YAATSPPFSFWASSCHVYDLFGSFVALLSLWRTTYTRPSPPTSITANEIFSLISHYRSPLLCVNVYSALITRTSYMYLILITIARTGSDGYFARSLSWRRLIVAVNEIGFRLL
ncbi:hypothetical protein EDD16DRAFT_1658260, partial [Pisolithus croceorrhizus]